MIIFLINQTIYIIIMKKLIRKILKEVTLKQNLIDQINEFGWVSTATMVGGKDILFKVLNITDPSDILDMHDDLNVELHNFRDGVFLFMDDEDVVSMSFDNNTGRFGIYSDLLSFLMSSFGSSELFKSIQTWVRDNHHMEIKSIGKLKYI
jgi:hypothetical protein